MSFKVIFGHILISIGEQMVDESSKLSRNIELSEKQFESLIMFTKIATSPQVQMLTIGDLAMRWDKTNRTVQNWLHDGVIPKGRIYDGDTRMYWRAMDIDAIEDRLVDMGYIKKPRRNRRLFGFIKRISRYI